ncbi:MAG TPA: antibiotic biosynthesis monooxygenase [Chloroflexota bacterium]
MYVRLVRFTFGPGKHDAAQKLADDLIPAICAQPGCKNATCFGDSASGDYGLTVLWDSEEHADAASAVIGPKLEEHLAGNAQSPPERRLFAVLRTSA